MTEKWQEYAVHDEKQVRGFFGFYGFLSNFYPTIVYFEGIRFPSSENAFQASKTLDLTDRERFSEMTPAGSKKEGRLVKLRPDWEAVKIQFMQDIVANKFDGSKSLMEQLRFTGTRHLEETNHWGDEFWGVNKDTGIGKNNLGFILMNFRRIRLSN